MNHKQKLGYMALGAGILALGIIIGQFVTPDIEAQSNGVFDEIQCKKLTVGDKWGKRIELGEHGNNVTIYDSTGGIKFDLGKIGADGFGFNVFGRSIYSGNKIVLFSDKDGSSFFVRHHGGPGIYITAGEDMGMIKIIDKEGRINFVTPWED